MKNTDCINGDRSMAYEREFTKPYPSGWENIPSHNTPVTAEIMDDYDDAIEHIEDFLNGSTAIFPIQATGGMTQPVGIDENGRLVTMPGGGTAESVTYDNTESELESTDVQGAIDELASGAGGSTAATTTYDNTESGLEAENVQDAIDEVITMIGHGGSGGGWTKLLDVRDESSQTASSYTLADAITNYETIALAGYFVHTLGNVMHVETLPIEMIEVNSSVHQVVIDNTHLVTLEFPTTTSVEAVSSSGNTYIYQVYGYRGGSSRTETELISAPIDLTTVGMSIALSDSIKNYDELILKCSPSTATEYNLETRFTLSDFVYGSTSEIYLTNEYHYSNGTGWFGFHPDSTGDNLIVDTANYCILQNAIGVKY